MPKHIIFTNYIKEIHQGSPLNENAIKVSQVKNVWKKFDISGHNTDTFSTEAALCSEWKHFYSLDTNNHINSYPS